MPDAHGQSCIAREPLLSVENLHTHFQVRASAFARPHTLRAVDGVSFRVCAGQSFGIVGESGSGKSTLIRTILRLIPATSGAIRFRGVDLLALRGAALRTMRREMQIVFQDPGGSLNPRLRVETIVGEAARVHGLVCDRRQMRARVAQMLEQVGLSPTVMDRYPHEFSGGQKQRIGIARALCLAPKLLVLDEPTSALDVSIQAQVLDLLMCLKQQLGLTYLFVSHNLAVVRQFCNETAVMQCGQIVERGPTATLFENPSEPYTRTLLNAILEPELPLSAG
jgi:ABC-type oligopeptide transport system ATPase subunit